MPAQKITVEKVGLFLLYRCVVSDNEIANQIIRYIFSPRPRDLDIAEYEVMETAEGDAQPVVRYSSGERYFVQMIYLFEFPDGRIFRIYGETDENGEFIKDRDSMVFLLAPTFTGF